MKTFNHSNLRNALGDLLLSELPEYIDFNEISIDTRSLNTGAAFVAIVGEQFDGHHFAEMAMNKGASVLIVQQKTSLNIAQIIVSDTRLALAALATAIRQDFQQLGGIVIGLTGSVGKTTNKQMLASICKQTAKTHATKGNLNNDFGVPLTWFDLPDDAHYAVIEMGANHQQEIAYLAEIVQPDIAMITNAGASHLEGFGGLDGVASGKGELFSALTAGQTAVINKDDHYADYWKGLLADGVLQKTFSLNQTDADVHATEVSADGSAFTLCYGTEKVAINLPTVGLHNTMNALGSAACALAAGIDLSHIALGLSQFQTAKGRWQTYQNSDVTLIDDTYNANPMSIRASANIFSQSKGLRLIVLGDMGELGENAKELHAELGVQLTGQADYFYCLGDNMQAFAEHNPDATHYADKPTLYDALIEAIKSSNNAVNILVKGSRFMAMETIVNDLLDTFKMQLLGQE